MQLHSVVSMYVYVHNIIASVQKYYRFCPLNITAHMIFPILLMFHPRLLYALTIATYFKNSDESKEQELQDQASLQPAHYDSEQAAAPNQDHCEYNNILHTY